MENLLVLLPNRPQSILIRYGATTLIVGLGVRLDAGRQIPDVECR
jgi:hypothetical protein